MNLDDGIDVQESDVVIYAIAAHRRPPDGKSSCVLGEGRLPCLLMGHSLAMARRG